MRHWGNRAAVVLASFRAHAWMAGMYTLLLLGVLLLVGNISRRAGNNAGRENAHDGRSSLVTMTNTSHWWTRIWWVLLLLAGMLLWGAGALRVSRAADTRPTLVAAREGDVHAAFRQVVTTATAEGTVTLTLRDSDTSAHSTLTLPIGAQVVARDGQHVAEIDRIANTHATTPPVDAFVAGIVRHAQDL